MRMQQCVAAGQDQLERTHTTESGGQRTRKSGGQTFGARHAQSSRLGQSSSSIQPKSASVALDCQTQGHNSTPLSGFQPEKALSEENSSMTNNSVGLDC